jgi:hypothetical protein
VLQIEEVPLTCTVDEKNRIRERILECYWQGQRSILPRIVGPKEGAEKNFGELDSW